MLINDNLCRVILFFFKGGHFFSSQAVFRKSILWNFMRYHLRNRR